MDYNKINKIDIDGNGNINLQDVNGKNITVSYNDTEEFSKLLSLTTNEILIQFKKIFTERNTNQKFRTIFEEHNRKIYWAFEIGYAPIMISHGFQTNDERIYSQWRLMFVECAKNFGFQYLVKDINENSVFSIIPELFIKMSSSENNKYVPFLQLSYNFIMMLGEIKRQGYTDFNSYTKIVNNISIKNKFKISYKKIIENTGFPLDKDKRTNFINNNILLWINSVRDYLKENAIR